jgi:GNAT superfamily N-acetyltransferase
MINNLTIRPVNELDYDQWLLLWEGYNVFYKRSGPTALSPVITQTTWKRFFDDNEPVFALVAESNGKLVGMAHYLFHRSTSAIQPVCYLQDLFTTDELRGKGIGRALIESVHLKAKDAGASRYYWLTHETNENARKLYDKVAERSGFIVYRKTM